MFPLWISNLISFEDEKRISTKVISAWTIENLTKFYQINNKIIYEKEDKMSEVFFCIISVGISKPRNIRLVLFFSKFIRV